MSYSGTRSIMRTKVQFHAPDATFLGNEPWYPSERRLGGPQSRYGDGSEEGTSLPCRESNPGLPAHSLIIIVTEFVAP